MTTTSLRLQMVAIIILLVKIFSMIIISDDAGDNDQDDGGCWGWIFLTMHLTQFIYNYMELDIW